MRAITIETPGGPEALVLREVPDPVAGPGEVLVEVAASAVNRADVLQRQGFYDPPPGASRYPGLECSGRVVALGRTRLAGRARRTGGTRASGDEAGGTAAWPLKGAR